MIELDCCKLNKKVKKRVEQAPPGSQGPSVQGTCKQMPQLLRPQCRPPYSQQHFRAWGKNASRWLLAPRALPHQFGLQGAACLCFHWPGRHCHGLLLLMAFQAPVCILPWWQQNPGFHKSSGGCGLVEDWRRSLRATSQRHRGWRMLLQCSWQGTSGTWVSPAVHAAEHWPHSPAQYRLQPKCQLRCWTGWARIQSRNQIHPLPTDHHPCLRPSAPGTLPYKRWREER